MSQLIAKTIIRSGSKLANPLKIASASYHEKVTANLHDQKEQALTIRL